MTVSITTLLHYYIISQHTLLKHALYIQHNYPHFIDTMHYDSKLNDTLHYDIQHNDIQNNDTWH
jgi:hypothetical protein